MPIISAPNIFAYQKFQSGCWYSASNNATTSAALGNGSARVAPIWVPNPCTINNIGAEVTVVGSAGSVIRLGIWLDNGQGFPGTLLGDYGTISGVSATVQAIGITQAVTPGLIWVGGVLQGAPTTDPTVRCLSQTTTCYGQLGVNAGTAPTSSVILGYLQSSVTGALGNWTGTLGGSAGAVPRVMIKIA